MHVDLSKLPAPAPAAAQPPLWRAMRRAYLEAPETLDGTDRPYLDAPETLDGTDRMGFADQIFAVRDRLFPGGRPDPVGVSHDCLSIWTELTAEAARAEAGE